MTQGIKQAFPGSFFTTTEYEEAWGEGWEQLFPEEADQVLGSDTAALSALSGFVGLQ